jgi:hypothetical protein
MNASATKAVPLNFAKFLIIARGKKTTSCAKMRYRVWMKVLQSVTARTKACRFSAIKMV